MKDGKQMVSHGETPGSPGKRPAPPPKPPARRKMLDIDLGRDPLAERLVAEYGTSEIELVRLCDKYLGLNENEAKRRASLRKLPLPAYRIGTNKAPWLVSADQLAKYLRAAQADAEAEHLQCQG